MLAVLYRPLVLASVLPDVAEARGIRPAAVEIAFLLVLALVTAMTVPVVGAFLMFSLLVAPAGSARSFTAHPMRAMVLSVAIALVTVWAAIVASYETNWPIGFFVGTLGLAWFAAGRGWAAWRRTRITNARSATGIRPVRGFAR